MVIEKKKISCCKGQYHILMNGKYYCMAPPNILCDQQKKDVGKFTRGEKKIPYCMHHQNPCTACKNAATPKTGQKTAQED